MKISELRLRTVLLAFACALAGAAPEPAASTDQSRVIEGLQAVAVMAVEGRVIIQPDGSVAEVHVDTKIDADLAKSLEAAIRYWHFKPVLIAGEPRRVSSRVRMQLAAIPQEGERYKVIIDGVDFPDAFNKQAVRPDGQPEPITAKRLEKPVYPSQLVTRGVMGAVMLAIRVTPDGKAGDVMVVQSQLYETQSRIAMSVRSLQMLEAEAADKAKRWTFNVPPGGTRSASSMTVVVPVVFTLGPDLSRPGHWLKVQRTEKQPIAWLPSLPSRSGPSLATAAGGSVSQLGMGPQLAQDVAGMSLQ